MHQYQKHLVDLLIHRIEKSKESSTFQERIFGSEHELGIEMDTKDEDERDGILNNLLSHQERTPLLNGGFMYIDMRHPEICSPETLTIRDVIIYEKAMEINILNLFRKKVAKLNPILYKNTTDGEKSFGAHTNYETSLPVNAKENLIPFCIVQKLLTGSGYLSLDNNEEIRFKISERAPFLQRKSSNSTTSNERGLLNERDNEPFGNLYRLHDISNDANMCEGALGLKIATMKMMLLLAENSLLPNFEYDYDYTIHDLRTINSQQDSWHLFGMPTHMRNALDIMAKYQKRANSELIGFNNEFDFYLSYWSDTIEKLRKIRENRNLLIGRLDWVTKRFAIETLENSLNQSHAKKFPLLRSNALEYHRLGEEGIYSFMYELGMIERLVSLDEIKYATTYPPENTRASARAEILRLCQKNNLQFKMDWNYRTIILKDAYGNTRHAEAKMPNPHCTYPEVVKELEERIILNNIST